MKRICFLLMLIPVVGISQQQNVINASRYFPKADKVMEFEKALTAHIQKFHSGDWKWRVYDIQTGPDAGGYHITEGPKSWEEFDKRGNLGDDHIKDWNKTVAIYLTDRYSSTYAVYREELSTVALGEYSDKIIVTHVFPKIGMGNKTEESLKKVKKAWASGSQTVAVYSSAASGQYEFALVSRLKNGLSDMEGGKGKSFKERYEEANGEGTHEIFLQRIGQTTDHSFSELLFYRADLSAK